MVKIERDDLNITSYCSKEYLDKQEYCPLSIFIDFVKRKMIQPDFLLICQIKTSKARLLTFWIVLGILIFVSIALTFIVIRIYSKLEMFRDDEEDVLTIGSMLSGKRKSSISMFDSEIESVN